MYVASHFSRAIAAFDRNNVTGLLVKPKTYTLHPTPYTLHPTPCTLHPVRREQHSLSLSHPAFDRNNVTGLLVRNPRATLNLTFNPKP